MNPVLRKSLMATAIAALISSPAWAGTPAEQDATRTGADPSAAGEQQQHPAVQPGAAPTEGAAAAESDRAMKQMADQHPGIKGTRSDELFSKSAQELKGTQVVDSSGAEIGTVESVVSSRAQPDQLFAVISPGAEGAQGAQMLLSLDELRWAEDKLHASAVKADLQSGQKPYQADQYAEIEPADQPIREFSAFEPVPGDKAREGQPSPQEPGQSSEQPAQSGEQPAQPGAPTRPNY